MVEIKKPAKYGDLWLREELILAFGLYCRIPFKKTKANNPIVIKLAKLLHRSPASVARKLGNFGSLRKPRSVPSCFLKSIFARDAADPRGNNRGRSFVMVLAPVPGKHSVVSSMD